MRRSFRVACIAGALAAMGLGSALADDVADATALLGKGQADAALTLVDTFLKNNPKNVRARFLRGVILSGQQKTDDAIAAFRSLSEEWPEMPEPYNNLGVLYASRGRYDEARRALESAVLADPKYATAHENLGDVYVHMATQSYRLASELNVKNVSVKTKLKLIEQLFEK